MGSSCTVLGESAFWAPDHVVELWLLLLADAIDNRHESPAWAKAAASYWREVARHDMGPGMAEPNLDEIAKEPDRRAYLHQVNAEVSQALNDESKGELKRLSADHNAAHLAVVVDDDVLRSDLFKYGRILTAILNNEGTGSRGVALYIDKINM